MHWASDTGPQHGTGYGLLTTDYTVQTTDDGLQVTDYGLRTTGYGLRAGKSGPLVPRDWGQGSMIRLQWVGAVAAVLTLCTRVGSGDG